jgi:polyphosphate glucokinase
MKAIGIDIGGTRIKAAVVDLETGRTITKRQRIDTPRPATPEAILSACEEVIRPFGDIDLVGVGFPGVIRDGKVFTAANLDSSWVEYSLEAQLEKKLGKRVKVLNDADAAGFSEIRVGAGVGVSGTVILLTVGTGLGSAVFTEGKLVRNTEFGRMKFGRNLEAEAYVSETAREEANLGPAEWAKRFEEVLQEIESLYWPSMIIVGGGGAKKFDAIQPLIKIRATLCHATTKNKAGIIGAALWAAEKI